MNQEQSSERMSVRKSLLVWASGILIGWAIAFGLILTYYAATKNEPITDQDAARAQIIAEQKTRALNDIVPAAGGKDSSSD
jgi:hypothetical protein